MTDQHALYIDGNWVNTPETLANINPVSYTHLTLPTICSV